MDKYLTELIGTFFLVFAIGMAMVTVNPLAPLAIGITLTALVYMGGHVSGAHYNPAVTLAVWLRGKIEAGDVGPYIGAQLGGALAAAALVGFLTDGAFAPAPGPGATAVEVLIAEALLTFALVLVIFNVAFAKATEGNSYYGLAIGFVVTAGAFAVGPISGGAFNPAVGTGPILVNMARGLGGLEALWYYWVGPLIGAWLATLAFGIQDV